jgi:hypothetical protein
VPLEKVLLGPTAIPPLQLPPRDVRLHSASKAPKTPKSTADTKRERKATKAEENGGVYNEDGVNVKSEDELMGYLSMKPKVEEDDDDDGDGTYMG